MTRSTAPLRCAHLALALVIAAPMLRPAFAASPESASRADVVLEKTFASSDDFEVCTRDAAIDATSDAGAIRLVDEDFIIHAQGDKLFGTTPKTGTGRKLSFSGALLGKKTFPLTDTRSRSACLSVFGAAGQALFNGHPVVFTQIQHQAGWSFATLAPEWLKAGDNELVMTNGFRLPQDRETDPPRFSRVSRDGGNTWEPAAGGEFLINLRLHRHPRAGVITSPVIDLANPTDAKVIAPLAEIGAVTVTHQAHAPAGTTVVLETRAGDSPMPNRRWSAWRTAARAGDGRYLQWRATLQTDDPLATPALSNVTVTVGLTVTAAADSRGLQLADLDDHPMVIGSYPYSFQRPSRKLKKLREQYQLDAVVATGRTDFEKMLLLRNWVRRQWRGNDGFGGRWDALEILAAPPGKKGMCVHYANLFSQCALALGYCARPVVINHHFIADVWSPDHGKWVAMDVEAIYPPLQFDRYATAHYVNATTREPLSILDVSRAYHRALNAGAPTLSDVVQVYTYDNDDGQAVPHDTIRPTSELHTYGRVGYPPRNDHLDRLEPWEEYHGQDHYHSNGYLWWRGQGPHAQSPQYSWTSDRVGDFEWTLDRVALGLTAGRKSDQLTVTAQTLTPNFDTFRYRIDGGKWRSLSGKSNDPDLQWAELDWRLHDGANVLEIRSTNRFSREGAVSRVEVRRET